VRKPGKVETQTFQQTSTDSTVSTDTEAYEEAEEEAEEKRGREKIAPKSRAARKAAHPAPEGVEAETWRDWLQLRKSKSAPVSPTVIKQAKNEALKVGITLQRFLEIWCLRGSQGLQADWIKPNEIDPNHRPAEAKTFRQRDEEDARAKVAEWTGGLLKRGSDFIDMEKTNGPALPSD
jgi:hypothetical protein